MVTDAVQYIPETPPEVRAGRSRDLGSRAVRAAGAWAGSRRRAGVVSLAVCHAGGRP